MACFIVPLVQAVTTTVVRRHTKNSENKNPFIQNLSKLETMLWGGSAMLIVDHVINGEVVPYYPFFSALEAEGGAFTMLSEMVNVGLPMSIAVTLIWVAMVAKSCYIPKISPNQRLERQ